jgi:mono/diheme cytochrome c family protein
MTTNNTSADKSGNIYIASLSAILLIVIATALVWVSQFRQAIGTTVAVEPTGAAVQPVAAPAQTSKGDPAAGQTSFTQTCSACHGPTGEGLPNLGKNLTTSEFVKGQADDQLIGFIKVGRLPSDPLNTTGIAMPPKGGNPALGDKDLENIVAFIRTLHR